jgi:hypothetical protein
MNDEDLQIIKSLFSEVEVELDLKEKKGVWQTNFLHSNEYKMKLRSDSVYIECFIDLSKNDLNIKEIEEYWKNFTSIIGTKGYKIENSKSSELLIINDHISRRPIHIYFGGSIIYR